ncbi:MAG: adenosylhomocysteinase [Candidatus Omnitrophota bacterium]|nr:MAG: adenosylhomocysteinase [Candidatus Omnitrophota bacterium]
MEYRIKDINLAEIGRKKTEWACREMKVLGLLRKEDEKSLNGLKIGCCLHITSETSNFVITLKKAGAKVFLCASNPLSTQDDVAAYLVKEHKIEVFGKKGESEKEYYENLKYVMEKKPDLVVDDGGDLITNLHKNPSFSENVIGATEETTTGVIRLENLSKQKLLQFPVIAVNNAHTKYLFDNRYGTGQSTVDGFLRATNILISGKIVVVCGYGWCGKGVAKRFSGMGARVIVTEVNPVRALEAVMDGFWVMKIKEAAKIGDIFITTTGNRDVIGIDEILKMKDGAILANSGHFNVEIDVKNLEKICKKKNKIRDFIEEYLLPNGKRVYLLGEGRLLNLACAEGHPSSVMDMSFSNQFLSLKYLKDKRLPPDVYNVPEEIDRKVAELKLKTLGIKIDKLSKVQKEYLSSWKIGT